MAESPRNILARLEQLKLWQEEQQQVLLQKQIAQRELLNQEQKKMYTILGIGQTAPPQEESGSDESEFEETNMQRQLTVENEGRKVPAKPFLKRGAGLKARFKVDPNVFKLDNLPKYKYANHAKNREQKKKQNLPGAKKVVADLKPPEVKKLSKYPKVALDINKVQQTKLVVPVPAAPLNYTNSVESFSEETLSEESLLPSIESIKLRQAPVVPASIEESAIQPSVPWKQQLQDEASLLRQLKELKDLNLFEFIEQRLATGNGSVASDASALLRLLSENSINISDLALLDSTLLPAIPAEPLVQPEEVRCLDIRPAPDPKRHFLQDEESSSESSESDEESDIHVRFATADDSEQQDDETDLGLQLETVNYSRMSTPKEKQTRKSNDVEETIEEDDTAVSGQNQFREDMLEKSELLKKRLGELETEIDSFRKENAELTRMKQEHELDKIKLEHEREEMMEKLNDERIKMEVYFHDERIKIEDQRQKAVKEAMKPTKKEKEDILRLKEQVAELQKELKAKEAKHASSLARFRSQIKCLEKDLKETQLELDVMKKDNKKLETENARLKRQNNNRMLLEINKNIAKLAVPQSSSESRRNSSPEKPRKTSVPSKMKPIEFVEKKVTGKVVKAKVISHPRPNKPRLCDSSSSESDPPENPQLDSSDEMSGCETLELSKSSYFKAKSKKTLFNSDEEQPNKCADENSTLKDPETAKLIQSLKREVVNGDGSRDIWYPNGNLKKISPDGLVMRMLYFNKDIKETNLSEGTTKYYYFETNTWHTTYLDRLEILEFPDGQTEHRFKDGSTEVHFPNGSIRTTNPNSADTAEEWKYADGSTVLVKKNDDKVITLPNGQVEIHTRAHKRRIYPDGTIKFLYPDGSQESRYSNGRVRLKDKDGRLISDTGGSG